MNKDLGKRRKIYEKEALIESNIPDNPMQLFSTWFHDADDSDGVDEANAVSLSTVGDDGFPKSRVVLLKRFTWEGFVFYSNYLSEKGKAMEENPKVCLSFFWPFMERQIIIKGIAEKLSENLSDGYFESRPDGSKLGAWASEQSAVIESRDEMDKRLSEMETEFKGKPIPRPKHWGGYIIKPKSIEFWQGRPNRMHDRIRFTLQKDFNWKIERLNP